MKYGLSDQQLKEIKSVLASYEAVEEAILFGSRAIDTYKEASDIDIAIKGEKADWSLAATLKDHLEEETYLPFFFDVVAYDKIESEELKRHVDEKGVVLYKRGMSEWREVRLESILDIKYGKDHKKLQDGLVPCYGTGGIMRYVNDGLYNEESILIPRKGSLNNIYYIDEPFWTVDTLFWTKIDKDKVFSKFLFYQLTLIDFTILNVGSAVPSLTVPVLNEIDISLPPLPEQKAIAEVLSSLDDKIDLLHRQNKTLEQMAETLFRQWFVVEAGEDWEYEEIINYVSVVDNRGKTPPNTSSRTPFPLIEVNALGKDNRLVDYSVIRKYVDEDTFNNWFRNEPKKYDTLLSTVGSIGAISMYLLEEGNVAQNVIGLSAKNISPLYLFQALKYKAGEILQLDIGGVQPSIKVPHLLSLIIPIPPTEMQKTFDCQVIEFVSKMERNYKQIHTLQSLRDTLLPKLMSGEVRVNFKEGLNERTRFG